MGKPNQTDQTEPDVLQQFETTLRAQHEALTKAYEEQHVIAENEWAKHEANRAALSGFRSKYGRVLKALDEGRVKVAPAGEQVTSADVGAIKVEG